MESLANQERLSLTQLHLEQQAALENKVLRLSSQLGTEDAELAAENERLREEIEGM